MYSLGVASKKRKRTDAVGPVEHRCESCTFGSNLFSTLGNLRRHQSTHTGARPHVCVQCNKDFARTDDLKSHMKTHSTEKPHECTVIECAARFKRLSDCRKHERRVHHYHHKKMMATDAGKIIVITKKHKAANKTIAAATSVKARVGGSTKEVVAKRTSI